MAMSSTPLPASGPQLLKLYQHAKAELQEQGGSAVARDGDEVRLRYDQPDDSLSAYKPLEGSIMLREDHATLVQGSAVTADQTQIAVREHQVYEQMVPIGSHQTVRTSFDKTYLTQFVESADDPGKVGVTIYQTGHMDQGGSPMVFARPPVNLTLDANTGQILQ